MEESKKYLRPAIVIDTDRVKHTLTFQYMDRSVEKPQTCTIAHPFAGPGWGVLAIPSPGSRIMIGLGAYEQPYMVSSLALGQYSAIDFTSPRGLRSVSVEESPYPTLQPGEIALQSIGGSKIQLYKSGDINIQVDASKIEYSNMNIVAESFNNKYINTEAHRQISGTIKRDIRSAQKDVEKKLDKLLYVNYDNSLTDIGKNPILPVADRTIGLNSNKETVRNPALVENRSIVYEFNRTSMVENYDTELARIDGVDDDPENRGFLSQPNRRDMLRTDILNIGQHLPNTLIEKVEGTVVDIYGHILDINRTQIDFSNVDVKPFNKRMEIEHKLLKRSIKYHFELNARKETLQEQSKDILDSVPSAKKDGPTDAATATGYSHSRLSLDVDGEGFIKVNIPATSNHGNIPLLSRYLNSFDEADRNSGAFRSEDGKDIRHIPFGYTETSGIPISGNYLPASITKSSFNYRTAYHDIRVIAPTILADEGVGSFISNTLDNAIDSENANAGGRSIHMNLDGSLELNIGRDVADRKSILLDTAGSIISHIGKDNNKNSIVSHMDGNVKIQLGGATVRGEDELVFNNFSFYVKAEAGYHKITLNEKGIFLNSAPNTNIVFDSSNNLILKANGQVLVSGAAVSMYGNYSNDGNDIAGHRLIVPNGVEIR